MNGHRPTSRRPLAEQHLPHQGRGRRQWVSLLGVGQTLELPGRSGKPSLLLLELPWILLPSTNKTEGESIATSKNKTKRRCIVLTHLRHRVLLYHILWFLLRDLVRLVRCSFQCVFCCSFLTWNIFTGRFRFPKWTKQLVSKILFQIWKKQEIPEKIINVV